MRSAHVNVLGEIRSGAPKGLDVVGGSGVGGVEGFFMLGGSEQP